ncbi:HEPN domain-containing protein [Bacillus thuringiensis]|uniref:ApeA N-terminal domain 1-containing protein n=1 Tax=Bacillus thuringiensis TaxID=1428 RepID=UPI002AB4406C|nr:HEPN domain-containing protein [Bacillus thuringiensis]MDY8161896.1 hypothetical protein [Bacillus thuringiensis]
MKVSLSATGFWKINNSEKEYPGDLYLNEDDGGIVLYIRIPNSGPIMSYLKLPLEITFITGTTINGAQITLVDCVRISTESRIGSEEVFGYQAKFMLDGAIFHKEEHISFTKMQISIPGIIQWGNTSNYVKPDLDDNFTLIGLEVKEPIEIYVCEEYRLLYYLTFNTPFQLMKEEISLKQIPYVVIEARTVQTLDWFMKVSNMMKRLIEIAIGTPLGFDSMIVESPEIYYKLENREKHNKPLKVIHAFKQNFSSENSAKRMLKRDYLFNLSELRQANFPQWQEILTIMEPIIELYIDSLYNQNLSMSRHFLNVVQALETYHSRRITYSLCDFKKRVDKLLEIRPEAFRKQDKKFLLNGSYKHVTLKSRLADLILANFRFYFHTGDFNLRDFPQIIASTRNYYTHYDQKLEGKALKGDDLINAYQILRNILEFYLLKELGFEEEFIHKRIRERIHPIVTMNTIKKLDKI